MRVADIQVKVTYNFACRLQPAADWLMGGLCMSPYSGTKAVGWGELCLPHIATIDTIFDMSIHKGPTFTLSSLKYCTSF